MNEDDDPHTDQFYFWWGMFVAFGGPALCIALITGYHYL